VHRPSATFDGEVAVLDELMGQAQPSGLQRGGEAGGTFGGHVVHDVEVGVAADEADAAMPEIDQVSCGQAGAASVVDRNRGD